MDWLTFISSIVSSLAWPASVAIVVMLFRKQITLLLNPVSKVKYGDLELEFGVKIQETEETAELHLPKLQETGSIAEVRSKIMSIIPVSPKTAIVEAWRYLELVAIEEAKKSGISLSEVALRKPTYIGGALRNQGIIDEEAMRVFKHLRQLRNEAVHYDKMKVTHEEALSYLNTAMKLAGTILRAERLTGALLSE